MNEDKNKPQIGTTPPANIDNIQPITNTEPGKKPRFPGLSNAPQKPFRTLASDMAEAMAGIKGVDKNSIKNDGEAEIAAPATVPIKIPVNIPAKTFGGFNSFMPKANKGDIIHVSGNAISDKEDHPLHVLKNQAEPKEEEGTDPVDQVIDISDEDTIDLKPKFFSQFNFKPKTKIAKEPQIPVAVPRPAPPPAPVVPPAPIPRPVPTPPPPILKPEPPRERLRTYEGDVAKNFSTNKPNVIDIAIAESRRQNGDEVISNRPIAQGFKKITIVLASIVLIAVSVGGLSYMYIKIKQNNTPVVVVKKGQGLVRIDSQKNIDIQSLKKTDLTKVISTQLASQTVNPDKITEFLIKINTGTTSQTVTAVEFIDTLRLSVSDAFRRAVTDKWMIGVYSDSQQNYPFIILKTDFFENAFSGMLRWESSMPEELSDVFNYRNRLGQRGSFVDRVIMNRDIREYIARNGDTLILYTFIDKNTVLITTSEVVVPAIIDRIEKQSYVR